MIRKGWEQVRMGDYSVEVVHSDDNKDSPQYIITKEAKRKWLYQLIVWISIVTVVSSN